MAKHRRADAVRHPPLEPAAADTTTADTTTADTTTGRLERDRHRDSALLSSALTSLVCRGVATVSTVVMLGIAAKTLPQEQLGVVAVLTLLIVFVGFGDFGLGTLMLTRLPAANARDDREGCREIVGTTMTALMVTGAIVGVVGTATSFLVPWDDLLGADSVGHGAVTAAVITFFVCAALSLPSAVGGRVMAAMLRNAQAQVWLAAGAVVATVTTAIVAWLNLPMWTYVAAAAGAPALVALAQTYRVLWVDFPWMRPASVYVPFRTLTRYLRAAATFAVLTFSASIAYSIDSLVVSATLDAKAAAVFAVAARIFALVATTVGLAGQQMWSALADAIHRGDRAWVQSRYRRVLVISTTVTAVACAVLVAAGRPLIELWVGSALVPPWSLLIALAVLTLLTTTSTQASYLLAADEDLRTFAYLGLLMAVVNLVVSVLLTRAIGITGPVLGSLVSLLGVMAVPLTVLITRKLRSLTVDVPAPRAAAVGAG